MAERSVSAMDKVEIKTRTRALALWVAFAMENLVYNAAPGVGAIQCQRETRDADELKAVLRDWAQLTEDAHKVCVCVCVCGGGRGWLARHRTID